VNPECQQGKHGNCTDQPTDCSCPCHRTEENSQGNRLGFCSTPCLLDPCYCEVVGSLMAAALAGNNE